MNRLLTRETTSCPSATPHSMPPVLSCFSIFSFSLTSDVNAFTSKMTTPRVSWAQSDRLQRPVISATTQARSPLLMAILLRGTHRTSGISKQQPANGCVAQHVPQQSQTPSDLPAHLDLVRPTPSITRGGRAPDVGEMNKPAV